MSYPEAITGLVKGKRYNVYLQPEWCPKKLKDCLSFTGTFRHEAERYDGRPVLLFKDCVRGKKSIGDVEIESSELVYRVEEASATGGTRRRRRNSRKSTRRSRRH
jgi:hypothetical protein